MAKKSLKDILTGVKSSKTVKPDLKDLAMSPEGNKDGLKFAAKHDIEKHEDRAGNDDHIYQGSTTKTTKYKFQKDGVYEETLEELTGRGKLGNLDDAIGKKMDYYKLKSKRSDALASMASHRKDSDKTSPDSDYRFAKQQSKDFRKAYKKMEVKEEESSIDEKYMGFQKTEKALAAKGAKNPSALAAWIGRKKYGKTKFQAAAVKGKKLGEETGCNHSKAGVHCEMHGDKDCSGVEPKDMPKGNQKVLLDKKLKEDIINEVAPPNPKIEKWIKANKERFVKEYGKEKGTQVLYAKAWKMHGQSESGSATNTDYVGPGAAGWTTGRLDTGNL